LDAVANNLAAAQVGTEVGATSIEQGDATGAGPKGDKSPPQQGLGYGTVSKFFRMAKQIPGGGILRKLLAKRSKYHEASPPC
jgi:hypothetical protein